MSIVAVPEESPMPIRGHQEHKAGKRAGRSLAWRLSVPLACACAGLLAMTSMVNARGTDLRGGRHTDPIGLVSEQKSDVQSLRRTVRSLESETERLSQQVGGTKLREIRRQTDPVADASGLLPRRGPGLIVTLDDAPLDQEGLSEVDPNVLVVHQQDIQAVVNALWVGGAEAMSLQGQRIIATTGIKCVGNTVLLQGVPYSPPYRIVALGATSTLYDALADSADVQNYLDYTHDPYNLGWSLRDRQSTTVPAYTGALELQFARPVTVPGADGAAD